VLTDPGRRHGGWSVEEFLATGVGPIQWVCGLLADAGLRLGDRVLDFGCGAGRLSNALAEHAAEIVGVDIASSMIAEAARINRRPDRVRFVHYDGTRLPFEDGSFDSAVSLISIQHAPPDVQLACLVELLRVVRPGGALVLQIPSHPVQPADLTPTAMRAGIEPLSPPRRMSVGEVASLMVRVTNLGDGPWPVGQLIRLGNHWYANGDAVTWDDGRADLPHEVPAGGDVELELQVVAPGTPGTFELELDMVQDAVTWWAEVGSAPVRFAVTVTASPSGPAPSGPTLAVPAPAAPSGEQPTREQPIDEQPTREQPTREQSIDEQPTDEQPTDEQPGTSGRRDGGMRMHGMHVDLVRALFAHCDCTVHDIVQDDFSGPEWESYTYVVRR
jgi:SAM-dependent methyltransferase